MQHFEQLFLLEVLEHVFLYSTLDLGLDRRLDLVDLVLDLRIDLLDGPLEVLVDSS